jgi:dTDP-4-dehydrorhamnose 3,5-epimerase
MTMTSEAERLSAGAELASAVNRAATCDVPSVDRSGKALPLTIEGVTLVRLSSHHDNRGALTPVIDVRNPFWIEPIVYAYSITIRPGRIKGWGMHRLQTDRYYICRGCVRVVLFDGREDSPSCGRFAELYFTDASPGLLSIPPGVWHADQNWGDSEAQIVNFPTHPYNSEAPDKYRIDPHSGIIPFDWSLRDG